MYRGANRKQGLTIWKNGQTSLQNVVNEKIYLATTARVWPYLWFGFLLLSIFPLLLLFSRCPGNTGRVWSSQGTIQVSWETPGVKWNILQGKLSLSSCSLGVGEGSRHVNATIWNLQHQAIRIHTSFRWSVSLWHYARKVQYDKFSTQPCLEREASFAKALKSNTISLYTYLFTSYLCLVAPTPLSPPIRASMILHFLQAYKF